MKRFVYILFLLTTAFSLSGYSQKEKKESKAEQAFNAGEYYKAIDMLKKRHEDIMDKEEKREIIFMIAECYRKTADPKKAELWYKKALSKDYPNPIATLYYAEMLKMNGKYEEALDAFKTYQQLVPSDPRGENGVLSCELAVNWLENPNGYQVKNMKYFNTKELDFSPCYGRDDYSVVLFTSTRNESSGTLEHGATGQSFSDIYMSMEDKKGSWSTPVPLNEEINSEFDDGTCCISSDFNTLYFTRCKVSKNKSLGCEIYSASRTGEDWGKAKSLDIAGDSITIAHPAISPDNSTLYFVSDMEGSIGGKDIWMITKEGDKWSEPQNMGDQINTLGDEMFPYVHPDGTFYFSSNGHIGMGGLDIYKASQDDNGNWKVENMRYPINSSGDDFGIIFEAEVERGYFTTNREGRGDDIYSFYLPPLKFSIAGIVKDERTDEVIPGATVKSISSDGITLEAKTNVDGGFRFMLKPNTDYIFLASKEKYLNGKEKETTKGIDQSKEFTTTIYLKPIDQIIEIPDIFYNFASADLRPESMVSLDNLVEVLNDNPHITIELMSHTDSRGSDESNMELSQRRAQSVVDYLIEKGIAADRLTAKGYGESQPKVIDKKIAEKTDFFKEGDKLTESYINGLPNEDIQEIAHQINRRTEFKVLRTDYVP